MAVITANEPDGEIALDITTSWRSSTPCGPTPAPAAAETA